MHQTITKEKTMNILSLELKQVDKFLNEQVLDAITVPGAIGKNAEKYWILNCNLFFNTNNIIGGFLRNALTQGYGAVLIQKSPN